MVIFRQREQALYCYIAKLDLEAKVVCIEFDKAEHWGGRIELEGGRVYHIHPQEPKPVFPVALRATRAAL